MKSHTPLSIKSEHTSSHNRSPSAATMASHINSSGNTNLGGSLPSHCMPSTSPYGTTNLGASTGPVASLGPQPSPLSVPSHSAISGQPTHYNPLHYQTSAPANSSSMLVHPHHHNPHALLYPHAHHHHSTNEWYHQAAVVAAAATPTDPMNHLNHFSHHQHHLMHHATAY